MNLFWKKLFGGITSTAKLEAKYAKFFEEYSRYNSIKASKELNEYFDIYEKVKSSEFKENKKTLKSRKYSDTKWYRDSTKFDKLKNDSEIKKYYELLNNKELEKFLAFKSSNEYKLLGNPEEVKKNPELANYKKFETSAEYKLYTRFHDSYKIKEYEELKNTVSNSDFVKENEFWKNENRWETTDAHKIEKRYFELAENADIKFFLSIPKDKFKDFNNYQICFKDEFNWNSLTASKWQNGFHKQAPELKTCYSFANELQANNNGNNVAVQNGILCIQTKAEKVKATAWDAKKGFIEKDYNFTSDAIHAKNAVCQAGGIFRAKIRFTGSKDISHAFWLAADKQTPHINICKFNGKHLEVGIHWNSKFETKYSYEKITGLNFSDFFIYSIEWTDKYIVWKINDLEVFRTTDYIPTEKMVPMFSSFIEEGKKGGTGSLEVDYIEVFCKEA